MFEAVDYTPSRMPPGSDRVTVRQFMAHHEGMNLLSLAHLLIDQPMQRRFQASPILLAGELLLQERIPKTTAPVYPHASEVAALRPVTTQATPAMRVITDPSSPTVESHWLSNGRYHVAISSAGGDITHLGMDAEPAEASVELRLLVSVRDRVHFADVLRTLRRSPVVLKVSRYRFS
jgi:hypothetical protein